jgi:hypothetical protein
LFTITQGGVKNSYSLCSHRGTSSLFKAAILGPGSLKVKVIIFIER